MTKTLNKKANAKKESKINIKMSTVNNKFGRKLNEVGPKKDGICLVDFTLFFFLHINQYIASKCHSSFY